MTTSKKTTLLEGLNAEQLQAVIHKDGPLLIIAGAGTGKTTVITRRVAWLIEQGLAKPNEILALTFTEKAAGEMEERVDRLLPYGYLDLWISTFHAFGQRILEAHALEIGLPVNFRLLTQTELWVLIRENFEKFDLDYYRPLGSPSRFIHALIRHFSRAKDELITPQEYLDYARSLKLDADSDTVTAGESAGEKKRLMEVAAAYGTYQKLLVDNNALDFGDLINYTLDLLKKRPNILARYRRQFKYILIDEFQDTNLAQYELIKLLAQPANNITVVGDDDQSIYKFRGASVSNILKFKENYKQASQVTLVQNYRSCQNLLDLSYKFIQANSPDRLEDKLKISKKLSAQIPGRGAVVLGQYTDYHEEAESVIGQIVDLKEKDTAVSWSDFAILVRANDTAEVFVEALDNARLPFVHLSRRGLYRKPIVLDVLAYFRILDNYHESQSMFRVLNLKRFNFTHEDIVKILDFGHRKTYSTYESLKNPALTNSLSEAGRQSNDELLKLLEKHSVVARDKPVNELYVQVVADLELAKNSGEGSLQVQNLSYLDQFNRKVKDFVLATPHKLLRNFVQEMDLELSAGEQGSLEFDPDIGPDTIKVITVHSAKGLEFKYVFIVGLADKKFPSISRGEPIELPEKLVKDILPSGDFHIQEERRLFYVAMTRARTGLFFSYAQDYGGSSVRKPSVFIKELGLAPESQKPAPTGHVRLVPPEAPKTHAFTLPKSFSYTTISSFENCPLEYKYNYLLKIPRPGSGALSFGQTIHKTLENYLRLYRELTDAKQGELFKTSKKSSKAELPPFSKMKEFYNKAWVDEWFADKDQKDKYRKKGEAILQMVYKSFQAIPPRPKYLERPFKLGLGEFAFTGKIDRADEGKDGLIIIDYKTGADRAMKGADKDQLLIYQWAAQEFLKEKVEDLQFWYFDGDIQIKKFLGDEKQIEKIKSKLLQVITDIKDAALNDNFEKYHKRHQGCQYEDLLKN